MDWYVLGLELVDSQPVVKRKVAVPNDTSFFDLHHIIQKAMGWEDIHFHEFISEDCTHIGPFYIGDEIFDELDMGISMYEGQKILYIYDFSVMRKVNITWEGKTEDRMSLNPELIDYQNEAPADDSDVMEKIAKEFGFVSDPKYPPLYPEKPKEATPRDKVSVEKSVKDYIVTGEANGRMLVPAEAFSICCVSILTDHGRELYMDKERLMLCEKGKKNDKLMIPKVPERKINKNPERYIPLSVTDGELTEILHAVADYRKLPRLKEMDFQTLVSQTSPDSFSEEEKDAVTCAVTLMVSRIYHDVGFCVDYGYSQPAQLEMLFRDYNGDLEKVRDALKQLQQ